jgi:hypothetical protein
MDIESYKALSHVVVHDTLSVVEKLEALRVEIKGG